MSELAVWYNFGAFNTANFVFSSDWVKGKWSNGVMELALF